MTLLTPSEQREQVAAEDAVRRSYRSDAEIAMRDVLEQWAKQRWPRARTVHELVMGRGKVRADMAVIDPDHLVAFEIKGPYDNTERLVHQIAMFRLAVPELWIVVAGKHLSDAEMVRHLLPSVGIAAIRYADGRNQDRFDPWRGKVDRSQLSVHVEAEPTRFAPLPEALLSVCWVAELANEAISRNVLQFSRTKPPAHHKLVTALAALSPDEQLQAVCRQLRARQAIWRADPAIVEGVAA